MSRRWLLALPVSIAASVIAAGTVAKAARLTGATPSAWDVHAALVNNRQAIAWFGFFAFALLVGDVVTDDRRSTYAMLVVPRVGRRWAWWSAKVCSVSLTAVLVQVLFLVLCLAIGNLVYGWSLVPTPSEFAFVAAQGSGGGSVLFPPAWATAGALRHLSIAGYVALAYASLAAILLMVSVRFAYSVLPVLVAFVVLVGDFLFLKQVHSWFRFSPCMRILEGAHSVLAGPAALSWWGSLLYWSALMAVSAAVGGYALQRADL